MENKSSPTEPIKRLRGPWLIFAQAAWLAIVLLNLSLFLIAIPYEYKAQVLAGFVEFEDALAELGLTPTFYAIHRTSLHFIQAVAFTLVGTVIFFLKTDDRMVILTSLASITFGTLFVPTLIHLAEAEHEWLYIIAFVRAVGLATSLIAFYYIFPDGRFIPGWTRWVSLLWIGWTVYWFLFPNAPFNVVHLITWLKNQEISMLVLGAWYMTGVFAQVYRYSRVASPAQRQQTKWVVVGSTTAVAGFILYHLPPALFPILEHSSVPRLLYILLGVPIYHLLILMAPIFIGFAVLRYRLWDIDLIINHSLVYGPLTATIGGIYFGSVMLLEIILRRLTGQGDQLALIASTLAIVALFAPLRRRIQETIDRRFYRRKYNAELVLTAFSASLRDEVDLNQLTDRLVAVVEETMQPERISLWITNSDPADPEPVYARDENEV